MRNWTDADVEAQRRANELVDRDEAMAILGCENMADFLTGLQQGLYPPHVGSGYVPAPPISKSRGRRGGYRSKWRYAPKWRRGDLDLALVRLMERKIAHGTH